MYERLTSGSVVTWALALGSIAVVASLVVTLARVWQRRSAMRAIARQHGWDYSSLDTRHWSVRAADLIPDRDGPRGPWVERSYSTRCLVWGSHEGVPFDLCHLRVLERYKVLRSREVSWVTACRIAVGAPVFAGPVFMFGAPAGRDLVASTAAQVAVFGPLYAAYHGRTDIQWAWWRPLAEALGPMVANWSGVEDRIVRVPKGLHDDEFARRVVIVADDPMWADPLFGPEVRKGLLSHDRDWYFLLYAAGSDMMIVAAPRASFSQTRPPVLTSADDLLALVRLTTGLARAIRSEA
ncbi:MAG TPA: hypothetical protein VKD71_03445 [Gemmataceae bacterium]|nr:hypothetical protein [Gemmataceae bacterium]